MSENYSLGNAPLITDPQRVIEVKILKAINAAPNCSGGGSGGGTHSGTGSPEGVVTASPGETYTDTTTPGFWVKQTGSGTNTGWMQIV